MLTPQLDAEAARLRARGLGFTCLAPPRLFAYPMVGVRFAVGCDEAYVVVDPAGGRAVTCDPWLLSPLDGAACVQEVAARPLKQVLSDAYGALSAGLSKRWKLGRTFDATPVEVIDPLYKPNWLVVAEGGERILIDAVTGNYAIATRDRLRDRLRPD